MFSMLGIVLANNFVMMFIFWELVGVSSFLLIGHWFTRGAAAAAANKAFLTNSNRRFRIHVGNTDDLGRFWARWYSLKFSRNCLH